MAPSAGSAPGWSTARPVWSPLRGRPPCPRRPGPVRSYQDAALDPFGCAAEQIAHSLDQLALTPGHDDPADDACVLHVELEALMALGDQAGKVLDHRHCDADGRKDEQIERPLQRARVFLYGVAAAANVGLRHSPGRASSSCRPAGSGA